MNKTYLWFVLGVLAIVLLIFSVRVVDESRTCAVVSLGKVKGEARTGFQLVTPLVTSLSCYSGQQAVYQSVQDGQGDADYLDFPVEIKTSDGQTAFVEFNIVFFVEPKNVVFVRSSVAQNMKQVVTRVVANYSRSVTRDIAPEYSASELYGTGRVDYEKQAEAVLRQKFAENGITLQSFQLRDINFDPDYELTIENQQIAREQIETANFQAQAAVYEAQKIAELAKGQAQANVELAKGNAESVRINASAEAEAIGLKGKALQQNPEVLSLEFIQQLGSANWMMVPWDQIQGYLPLQPSVPNQAIP